MNDDTSTPSGNSSGNQSEPRQWHRRRAMALLTGALVLGGTAAGLIPQPGGAVARYPAATEAEARQSEVGWAMSAHFPNVRAWPESFGSLAFPNKCLYISVVDCP